MNRKGGRNKRPKKGKFRGSSDSRGGPAFKPSKGPGGFRRGGSNSRDREHSQRPQHGDHTELAAETKKIIQQWLKPVTTVPVRSMDQVDFPGEVLDPWQNEAFTLLLSGESVVVDAPTTAGKTRVVEAFFRARMNEPGFRAAYTTPVKSLTNDKLLEFREMFGAGNVGISTGDIKDNLDAPIVVATLESYRNSLLGTEPDLGRNLVVFDEYHFMQDSSRGSAWEEAIILSPPECQLLLLSASVANADDFCGWLQQIRQRPCTMVRTEHRPVPLVDLVYLGSNWLLAEQLPKEALKSLDHRLMRMPEPIEDLAGRIIKLEKLQLYPCIIYTGRRLNTELLARELSRSAELLDENSRIELSQRMNEIHAESGALRFIDPTFRNMLISYGVAYHHSGMAPPARVMVEKLLKEGRLRLCVATMGLSIGINFSVRSALIADYSRPDESGLVTYNASEILQMRGRAGRRGRDQVGFSLWASPEAYTKFAGAKRESCHSRLRTDPVTLLGLLGRGLTMRDIEVFYGKGFRAYQERRSDFTFIRAETLKKVLNARHLPCTQPASEYLKFLSEVPESLCGECVLRKNCHNKLKQEESNPLTALQLHLLAIEAIDEQMQLTSFGNVGRYFPQNGGLMVAQMIVDNQITEENLLATCQLMAALSLASFKSPGAAETYRFPWNVDELIEHLEDLYPQELFPEMYEDQQRGNGPKIREFNPDAGYAVKRWLQGATWRELEAECTSERFGSGDLMNLMYRTATYLQSVSQANLGGLSNSARKIRDELLREPLAVAVFG